MYPFLRLNSVSKDGPDTIAHIEIKPRQYYRYYMNIKFSNFTREWSVNILQKIAERILPTEATLCEMCSKELKIKYPLDEDQVEYDQISLFPRKFHRQYIIKDCDEFYYKEVFTCSDKCLSMFDKTVSSDMVQIIFEIKTPSTVFIDDDDDDETSDSEEDSEYSDNDEEFVGGYDSSDDENFIPENEERDEWTNVTHHKP